MLTSNVAILAAAEIALLFLVISVVLLIKNRALRKLVSKLQARLEQIVEDLKVARALKKEPVPTAPTITYATHIEKQLNFTKEYHEDQKPSQDISLDIDPTIPLPRRAAALRHAILLAEKESSANTPNNLPNWDTLNKRYEAIFSFYDDYSTPSEETGGQEEIDALNSELTTAKKRINNLEKFKQLYNELEATLKDCKTTAQTHFNRLSEMASEVSDTEAFESSLAAYHSSYDAISSIIETGIDVPAAKRGEDSSGEIRHLRAVAADQHKIITGLQKKLRDMSSDEERAEVVEELQVELNRQIRFAQESETCIQLMEDELQNANKEIEQLTSKLGKVGELKMELIETRAQNEQMRDQLFKLKTDNRKLRQKADEMAKRPAEKNGEDSTALKKELADLQAMYADLEEKFLDLKLQE